MSVFVERNPKSAFNIPCNRIGLSPRHHGCNRLLRRGGLASNKWVEDYSSIGRTRRNVKEVTLPIRYPGREEVVLLMLISTYLPHRHIFL